MNRTSAKGQSGRRWACGRAAVWLLLWLLACPLPGAGQNLFDDILDDSESLGSDLVDDLIEEATTPDDIDRIRNSMLTDVCTWPSVRPLRARKDDAERSYAWKSVTIKGLLQYASIKKGSSFPGRKFAQPLSLTSIACRVNVPEEGEYRIWIAQAAEAGSKHPVTLALGGANEATHEYGAMVLPSGTVGGDIESKFPVRFETQAARETPLFGTLVVWEYWDVPLSTGVTTFALQPVSKDSRIESIFMTQSKAFRPAKSMDNDVNTLTRSYYRFRVLDPSPQVPAVEFDSFIRYQWAKYRYNFDKRIWYGSMGDIKSRDGRPTVPPGEWSKWIDATETGTSSGRYATDSFKIRTPGGEPLTRCVLEIQYAWYPHPAGVLRTLHAPVLDGRTYYTFPATRLTYVPPAVGTNLTRAIWGVRDTNYVARFESEEEILDRILAPLDAPEYEQGPTPENLRIFTTCGVSPAAYDRTLPRLRKLGINWLRGPSPDVCGKYGFSTRIATHMQSPMLRADTHDPLDPTAENTLREYFEQSASKAEQKDPEYRQRIAWVKMGDEIGPIVGPQFVNGLPDCRKAYQQYLADELDRMGEDASFFGTEDLADCDYLVSLPEDAGRFQRRLYYYSCLYRWMLTSRFYGRYTKAVEAVYPKARTWCNFTPGSFMHAGIMWHSDWFSLSRYGGQTMSWGEDWLGGTGWYAMAGIQSVSYYAAIVDCAAREAGMPKGLLLVCRTGSIDRKMLSLAARGLGTIYLYSWGPEYTSGAVDSFSHLDWTYPEIAHGTRTLGLVDEVVAKGTREARPVALLYNQTHEFWHGAYAGMHFDRLLTYLALLHAHVPVDLIVEEDLTPERLAPYKVLYLNGFNLARHYVAAVKKWVEDGGTLYACSGAGMYDEFNDPNPETVALLGVRQQLAGISEGPSFRAVDITEHTPIDTLNLSETPLSPGVQVPIVGVKIELEPVDAESIGTYSNGSCGAALRTLGDGRVLTLGAMPGHLYRHNAPRDKDGFPTQYTTDRRALIAKAALNSLGPLSVTHSEPLVEVTRFSLGNDIAILVNDFSYDPGREGQLEVRVRGEVKEVASSSRGALDWSREGDRIIIPCPVPDPIESILIRLATSEPRPQS